MVCMHRVGWCKVRQREENEPLNAAGNQQFPHRSKGSEDLLGVDREPCFSQAIDQRHCGFLGCVRTDSLIRMSTDATGGTNQILKGNFASLNLSIACTAPGIAVGPTWSVPERSMRRAFTL